MKWFLVALAVLSLTACAPPPAATPAEQAARSAAAFELTAEKCSQHAGGYSDAIAINKEAKARLAKAKTLGATDAQIAAQRQVVRNATSGAEFWVGSDDTCKALVAAAAKAAA